MRFPLQPVLAILAASAVAGAQEHTVVFDQPNGFRNQSGNAYRIPDDDGVGLDYRIDYCPSCAHLPGGSHGELVGTGLFQSLLRLDVNDGDTATFAASEPNVTVDYIFARVTGESRSEIYGRLRLSSEVGSADLYLLNPYGVIFGETADLDVGGSFYVSTADVLRFESEMGQPEQNFEASRGGSVPTMVVAPPVEFGFLDTGSPEKITFDKTESVHDRFTVPAGETPAVVAGEIEIVGRGTASDVVALGSSGTVIQLTAVPAGVSVPRNIEELDDVSKLASDDASIRITDNAKLEVTGFAEEERVLEGRIVIRGGSFELASSGEVSAFDTGSVDGDPTPAIDIEVSGLLSVDAGDITSTTSGPGISRSGDIRLDAGSISLNNEANVLSQTINRGHTEAGPDIHLTTTGALTVAGGSLLQSSSSDSIHRNEGEAGGIWANAGSVLVTGAGSKISTVSDGSGDGATVHVEAATTVTLEASGRISAERYFSRATGLPEDVGQIEIFANTLSVSGGSEILASTVSKFDAADVYIGSKAAPIKTVTVTGGTIGSVTEAASGKGGDVAVYAGGILLQGDPGVPDTIGQISAVAVRDKDGNSGSGGSGNLTVEADSISLDGVGQIRTSSETSGQPGSLTLNVADQLYATGYFWSGEGADAEKVASGVFARGAAGDGVQLHITAGSIELENGADISTSATGDGKAGDMLLEAEKITVTGDENSPTSIAAKNEDGKGGRLVIDTGILTVTDGGEITTSTTGDGKGGDVEITAREVVIQGRDAFGNNQSGIFSQSLQNTDGGAGSVTLRPHVDERLTLRIRDEGKLSVESKGRGAAGDIQISGAELIEISNDGEISASVGDVNANGEPVESLASDILISDSGSLNVSGGVITATTTGTGPGGRIEIQAARVGLSNGAQITASSTRTAGTAGDAGSIAIAATETFSAENSQITTTANADDAGGGRISIQARDLVYLLDSLVETTVDGGTAGADAGDIFIPLAALGGEEAAGVDPVVPEFVVVNRSVIRANAVAAGAGDITINGTEVVISADSLIQAHSEEGVSGEIRVSSPDTDIVSQVAPLPSSFVDPSDRLLPPCVARTERTGSFMVQGREALPRPLDAPLPSNLGGAPGVDGIPPASGPTDCSVFQERS